MHGCKGHREFRLHCGEERLLSASSLWLWIDLRTRSLVRVPDGLAGAFPVGKGAPPFRSDVDKLRFTPPAGPAPAMNLDVRYSDYDANGHVNNTAFFDLLQTALARGGFSAQPHRLEIQFLREIPPGTSHVEVHLEARGRETAFALGSGSVSFAQGVVG